MSIYTDNGYENRVAYLLHLAQDNVIGLDIVLMLSDSLGPNEDFDGMVTEIEDYITNQCGGDLMKQAEAIKYARLLLEKEL